jgi:hypothetical protein
MQATRGLGHPPNRGTDDLTEAAALAGQNG